MKLRIHEMKSPSASSRWEDRGNLMKDLIASRERYKESSYPPGSWDTCPPLEDVIASIESLRRRDKALYENPSVLIIGGL